VNSSLLARLKKKLRIFFIPNLHILHMHVKKFAQGKNNEIEKLSNKAMHFYRKRNKENVNKVI